MDVQVPTEAKERVVDPLELGSFEQSDVVATNPLLVF